MASQDAGSTGAGGDTEEVAFGRIVKVEGRPLEMRWERAGTAQVHAAPQAALSGGSGVSVDDGQGTGVRLWRVSLSL